VRRRGALIASQQIDRGEAGGGAPLVLAPCFGAARDSAARACRARPWLSLLGFHQPDLLRGGFFVVQDTLLEIERLKRLHRATELELQPLALRRHLTFQEETVMSELKRKKLRLKDRLVRLESIPPAPLAR
jgi:hypothetical protein